MTVPSYPRVWTLGGRCPVNPFDGKPAVIQEKVDGSQFSFRRLADRLFMRSKGQQQTEDLHDRMFGLAVENVVARVHELHPGWIYRAEYLQKPKHNTLAYDRVPLGHLALFDIDVPRTDGSGVDSAPPSVVRAEAVRLQFDAVPTYDLVPVTSADQLLAYLDRESFLGGPLIEGVVLKRYDLIVPQFQAPLLLKFVSERFKEVHRDDWKNRNPTGKDQAETLASRYTTEARWEKAVQHLREAGELLDGPQDIGNLIKEVRLDVLTECGDEIKEALFAHWWAGVGRTLTRGLPEWYKRQLLERAFEETP